MEQRHFYETKGGQIVDNYDIAKALSIILNNDIEYDDITAINATLPYCAGIHKEIENPSIGLFINKDMKVQAIKLYYDHHKNCSLSQTKRIIEDMIEHHHYRSDFLQRAIPYVNNSYNETRHTSDNSIIFQNGWVASIVENTEHPDKNAKYSVAICDYNGYFDWSVLNEYGADEGCFYCNTEEEICKALTVIERLGF